MRRWAVRSPVNPRGPGRFRAHRSHADGREWDGSRLRSIALGMGTMGRRSSRPAKRLSRNTSPRRNGGANGRRRAAWWRSTAQYLVQPVTRDNALLGHKHQAQRSLCAVPDRLEYGLRCGRVRESRIHFAGVIEYSVIVGPQAGRSARSAGAGGSTFPRDHERRTDAAWAGKDARTSWRSARVIPVALRRRRVLEVVTSTDVSGAGLSVSDPRHPDVEHDA